MSRLAARNGAASVAEFCRDIGFSDKALVRGDRDAVGQLARLAGCDAGALWRVSIRNLGRSAMRLRDEIATTHTLHRSRISHLPGMHPAGCAGDHRHLACPPAADMAIRFDPVLPGASLRPDGFASGADHPAWL